MEGRKENAFARRMQKARDREFDALFETGGLYSPEGMTCGVRGCHKPAVVSFPRAWDEVQYRCINHKNC
ncbi:MAG: hypothetical protein V4437_02865 [Patescibacteria group bacterium]